MLLNHRIETPMKSLITGGAGFIGSHLTDALLAKWDDIALSLLYLVKNRYTKECLDTGWVSGAGRFVDLFEDKIANYTGAKYEEY